MRTTSTVETVGILCVARTVMTRSTEAVVVPETRTTSMAMTEMTSFTRILEQLLSGVMAGMKIAIHLQTTAFAKTKSLRPASIRLSSN